MPCTQQGGTFILLYREYRMRSICLSLTNPSKLSSVSAPTRREASSNSQHHKHHSQAAPRRLAQGLPFCPSSHPPGSHAAAALAGRCAAHLADQPHPAITIQPPWRLSAAPVSSNQTAQYLSPGHFSHHSIRVPCQHNLLPSPSCPNPRCSTTHLAHSCQRAAARDLLHPASTYLSPPPSPAPPPAPAPRTWPTAASTQQPSIFCTADTRPALMACWKRSSSTLTAVLPSSLRTCTR